MVPISRIQPSSWEWWIGVRRWGRVRSSSCIRWDSRWGRWSGWFFPGPSNQPGCHWGGCCRGKPAIAVHVVDSFWAIRPTEWRVACWFLPLWCASGCSRPCWSFGRCPSGFTIPCRWLTRPSTIGLFPFEPALWRLIPSRICWFGWAVLWSWSFSPPLPIRDRSPYSEP